MEVAYTAKADSDITCIAETDPEQWTGDDPDLPVRVRGVRDDGEVVIEGVIRLWVTAEASAELTDRGSADGGGAGVGVAAADHRHLEQLLLADELLLQPAWRARSAPG